MSISVFVLSSVCPVLFLSFFCPFVPPSLCAWCEHFGKTGKDHSAPQAKSDLCEHRVDWTGDQLSMVRWVCGVYACLCLCLCLCLFMPVSVCLFLSGSVTVCVRDVMCLYCYVRCACDVCVCVLCVLCVFSP